MVFMDNIVVVENAKDIEKLLFPMEYILDKKNITEGIKYKCENDKIYVSFDKDYLSDTNKVIFEKISFIYSETIFYSDNQDSPNADRLEYWCPDDDYDQNYHVTERIKNKKMFVLELDCNDQFSILGISIMLANSLQEQDPTNLKKYENANVLSQDMVERHQHYIDSGCPDLDWIQLTVSLNKDNPLLENWYAPFLSVCEINTNVSCDSMILALMVGNREKREIAFNIERENLEQVVKEFFEQEVDINNQEKKIELKEMQRKVLR